MDRKELLVVANQTVASDELHDALSDHAAHAPLAVTLLVPQDRLDGLGARLQAALRRLRDAGIEAEAMLGDVDPACAILDLWGRPRRWDKVILATLPAGTSRWLELDLPHRLAGAIDAPVTHVEIRAPVAEHTGVHMPA